MTRGEFWNSRAHSMYSWSFLLDLRTRRSKSGRRVLCSLFTLCFVFVVYVVHWQRQCQSRCFDVGLNVEEKALLLNTLDTLTREFNTAKIPFFLFAGSLLGSWRHHGIVPWDDEVDLVVPEELKENVRGILRALEPRYLLNEDRKVRWKFYSHLARPATEPKNGAFPFVDIRFFSVNDTHLWLGAAHDRPEPMYRKNLIFPLTLRPFEDRELPTPGDTEATLAVMLPEDPDVCRTSSSSWSGHREDSGERLVCACGPVACIQLHDRFPFVVRRPLDNVGCQETLMVNMTVLSWVTRRGQLRC